MGRKPVPDDLKRKTVYFCINKQEEAELRLYLQWLRQQAESVGGSE